VPTRNIRNELIFLEENQVSFIGASPRRPAYLLAGGAFFSCQVWKIL